MDARLQLLVSNLTADLSNINIGLGNSELGNWVIQLASVAQRVKLFKFFHLSIIKIY